MHDVTFRRFGSEAPTEMDKLCMLLTRRGAREVDGTTGDANIHLIAAGTVAACALFIDRLSVAGRRSTLLVGAEGTVDVRQVPQPGSLGALLEKYRPLGSLAGASIRKWRTHDPGFLGSKQLADRLGCSFHKAVQTPSYAAWLNGPGETAADFVLALAEAQRALAAAAAAR